MLLKFTGFARHKFLCRYSDLSDDPMISNRKIRTSSGIDFPAIRCRRPCTCRKRLCASSFSFSPPTSNKQTAVPYVYVAFDHLNQILQTTRLSTQHMNSPLPPPAASASTPAMLGYPTKPDLPPPFPTSICDGGCDTDSELPSHVCSTPRPGLVDYDTA